MTQHSSHALISRRTYVRAAVRRDECACWMQPTVIAVFRKTTVTVLAP